MSDLYHSLFERFEEELLDMGMDPMIAYEKAGEMAYDALPEATSDYFDRLQSMQEKY